MIVRRTRSSRKTSRADRLHVADMLRMYAERYLDAFEVV